MSLFQNLQNTLERAQEPVWKIYGFEFLKALNHFASKNDGVSFSIGDGYEVHGRQGDIEITLPLEFTKAHLLQVAKDIRHRVDSKIIDDIAAKYIRVGKYLSENADDAKFLLKNGRKFRSFDSREEVLALSKSVIEFGLALGGQLDEGKLTREEIRQVEIDILGRRHYHKELSRHEGTEISADRRKLIMVFVYGLNKSASKNPPVVKRINDGTFRAKLGDYLESINDRYFRSNVLQYLANKMIGKVVLPPPPFQSFQSAIKQGVESFVSLPEIGVLSQIVERGKQELRDNLMADIVGGDKTETLYEYMGIQKFKERIQNATTEEERDVIKLEALRDIHKTLSRVKYDHEDVNGLVNSVTERGYSMTTKGILDRKMTYCQGYSLLAQAYLEELGIKYLPMNISEHTTGIAIVGDRVYLSDMQKAEPFDITEKFGLADIVSMKSLSYFENLDLTGQGGLKDYYPYMRNSLSLFIHIGESRAVLATNLNTFGMIASIKGDLQFAMMYYKLSTLADPKYSYPENGLGNVYLNLKNWQEAIRHYELSILKDPKNSYPESGLGNVYLNLKNWQEAIRHYELSILKDPKNSYPESGLGNVYLNLKNWQEAIRHYELSILKDPKYSNPENGLGNAHYLKSKSEGSADYGKAIEHFELFIRKRRLEGIQDSDWWTVRAKKCIELCKLRMSENLDMSRIEFLEKEVRLH